MKMKVLIILSVLTFAQCKLLKLSCKDIRSFVDTHNAKRSRVAAGRVPRQPGTSSMKMMVWDEELQRKASDWAVKNLHMHNPVRTIPSGRFLVGENLYWFSTTDRNYQLPPSMGLDSWFNEHVNFTYGPVVQSDFDGSKPYDIGHYTQMIWGDSSYVGCAISQVQKGQWNNFMVVCNYGPTGNWIGSPPYKTEPPTRTLLCDHDDGCKQPYGPKCPPV